APAPTAAHLRHGVGRGRDRSAGAAGFDGTRQPRDNRKRGASVGHAPRRRVHRRAQGIAVVSVAASAADGAPLPSATELIAAYDTHVDTVSLCASVRFARRRSARRFVDRFPDPAVWMRRPTAARLMDLHRLKAWPFVSWCFVHRHLVPDVEILLAKPAGCGLLVGWVECDREHMTAS